MPETVIVIASGDLRLSANQKCWPAQARAEEAVMNAIRREGRDVRRGHPCESGEGPRIHRQPEVRDGSVPRHSAGTAPLVVVEAVWQYSHHVLAGLYTHRGPILTVANWSGEWPGLVGMLNLNASLTKAGVAYSTLWSEDFTDEFFLCGPAPLAGRGDRAARPQPRPAARASSSFPAEAEEIGARLAANLRRDKAIMGIFDEGCMGMYNAIIPDELLHATGVFKERLSQSALFAEMRQVGDAEARGGPPVAGRNAACSSAPGRIRRPTSPTSRFSTSARCTSRRCASPTISAATRSGSNTSRD